MKQYKAVFFDVGNTLLLPFPSVEEICAEVIAEHGYEVTTSDLSKALVVADRAYEERYWRDDTFWLNEVEASAFWTGLYELVLREVGVDGDASNIAGQIYRSFGQAMRWQPFPDVIPAFKELTKGGYCLGLISNWDTRLASLSVETGLSRYLDFVISSASVGWLKPQPQIFELALKRAGVKAKEAIHVGDHYYADIMGARSVGITPILIDRKEVADKADCLVIKDLYQLLDFLKG